LSGTMKFDLKKNSRYGNCLSSDVSIVLSRAEAS